MKPKVICHVMASVDGRLQVERWTSPYEEDSYRELLATYGETARTFKTDAWTFGRNTVKEFFPNRLTGGYHLEVPPKVFVGPRKSKRMFISFDPDANIIYSPTTFRNSDILAVVPQATATDDYLYFLLEKGVSYLVVDFLSDMQSVLEAINKHFGIESITLQGGGMLDGGMLNSNVIDELSVVVYPGLDCDNDSVSIFDKKDAPSLASTRLKLINVKTLKHGAVWLRYEVKS